MRGFCYLAAAGAASISILISASPAAAQPGAGAPKRLVPRAELVCRMRLGETAAQIAARPDPAPAACRSATAARSARPVAQCDGTVYVEGRAAGRFSARVILNIGYGAQVEFTPDPYLLSGEYLYADGVLTQPRPWRSNFSMRYDPASRRFEATTLINVTRQASPELALRMEGNPYANVAVRGSAPARLIADCTPA